MSKRTPLYATHLAAQARIVDFGGWDMPLHYGSQIDEHHAVRRDAGMFDVSHMCAVDLVGADVVRYLETLLANHIGKLTHAGRALYSVMLNRAGGVVDDLIVYRLHADTAPAYRLVLNAGTAETDLAHMASVVKQDNFAVSITPRRDVAIIAVQGPQARAKVWAAQPSWRVASDALEPFNGAALLGGGFIARTGYTGEDGFEIMLPARAAADVWHSLVRAGVAPCGLGARDTLRLEAGMNLYGHEMDETVSPLDAGLAWTVDLKSARAFIGREKLETLGQTRRLVGLTLSERGVLRAHMQVQTHAGEGEITSGTFSPTLGFSIAMARVPLATRIGDTVHVDLRGKLVPAVVVKMPFVRNGKALIS